MWSFGSAHAQFVAHDQTITIDNTVSNWSGHYYIGNGFYGNTLVVTNGGTQTVVSGNVYLGNNTADTNNAGFVTGSGSVWSNSGMVY